MVQRDDGAPLVEGDAQAREAGPRVGRGVGERDLGGFLAQHQVTKVEELEQVETEGDVRRAVRPVPRPQVAVGHGQVPLDPVAVPTSERELGVPVLALDCFEVVEELRAAGADGDLRGRHGVGPVGRRRHLVAGHRAVEARDVEQRLDRRQLGGPQPARGARHRRGDEELEALPRPAPCHLGYADAVPARPTGELERIGLGVDHRRRHRVPADLGEADRTTIGGEQLEDGGHEARPALLRPREHDPGLVEHRGQVVQQDRGVGCGDDLARLGDPAGRAGPQRGADHPAGDPDLERPQPVVGQHRAGGRPA